MILKKKMLSVLILICALVVMLSMTVITSFADDTATTETTSEATLTATPVGGETTTQSGTLSEMIIALCNAARYTNCNAKYELILNKDVTISSGAAWTALLASQNGAYTVDIKIDLNGHTLEFDGMVVHLFDLRVMNSQGILNFELDGADENGNVGKIIYDGVIGQLCSNNDQYNIGTTIISIKDIEVEYTNLANAHVDMPILIFKNGTINLDNVKINYTGADVASSAGVFPFITLYGGELAANDCELIESDTNGAKMFGIYMSGGKAFLNRTKIDVTLGINAMTTGCEVTLNESDIKGKEYIYYGDGKITVTDTISRANNGCVLAHMATDLNLLYGTGKNVIYANNGIVGSYKVENGCSFVETEVGVYTIKKSLTEVETPYGNIPGAYADAEMYPFAVFMDGEFIAAHRVWSQSNSASALWEARKLLAGNLGNGRTVQVLMRRDYQMNSGDEVYFNLAHFGGTLVIDLGENTFTVGTQDAFLRCLAQTVADSNGVYVIDTNIVIKGGNLVSKNNPVIGAYTNVAVDCTEGYTKAKVFNITFEQTVFTVLQMEQIRSLFGGHAITIRVHTLI